MRPVLFFLGSGRLPVYGYGAALGIAFVVAWNVAWRLGAAGGLDSRKMRASLLLSGIFAFIGARLSFALLHSGSAPSIAALFDLNAGGFTVYGGLLCGLFAALLYCRRHGLPFLSWADCAAPAVCLALAIIRTGCLLRGCCFGKPWDGPWSIQFPRGSPAFNQQVSLGLLQAQSLRSLPVHPTQLYESLALLVTFAGLLRLRRHRRFPGLVSAAFALVYAGARYVIELYRGDMDRGFVGPLSTGQISSLCLFIAGAVLLAWICLQGTRVWMPGLSVKPKHTGGA